MHGDGLNRGELFNPVNTKHKQQKVWEKRETFNVCVHEKQTHLVGLPRVTRSGRRKFCE